jgi:hypothetical protein
MLKGLSKFLKKQAVKSRIKGREKFLPGSRGKKPGSKNPVGAFDTDKFYDPKGAKKYKKAKRKGKDIAALAGTGGAGIYAVGGRKDPAVIEERKNLQPVSKRTKAKAERVAGMRQDAEGRKLVEEANAKTTINWDKKTGKVTGKFRPTNRKVNKLLDQKIAKEKDFIKDQKERDASYSKTEIEKDPELRLKQVRKEQKKTARTDTSVEQLKDWQEGKAPKGVRGRNIGALTGSETRQIQSASKDQLLKMTDKEIKAKHPGVNPAALRKKLQKGNPLSPRESQALYKNNSETLKNRQAGETARVKGAKQAKKAKDIEEEVKKLKAEGAEGSDMGIKSTARKNVEEAVKAKRKAKISKAPGKKKSIDGNQEKIKAINVKQGVPEEGKVRAAMAGERPGANPMAPQEKSRNYKKRKNKETGKVESERSRVAGTPKEEKGISGTAAVNKARKKARRIVNSKSKKPDYTPEEQEQMDKLMARINPKVKEEKERIAKQEKPLSPEELKKISRNIGSKIRKKDDPIRLSEKKKNINYGAVGAAVGATTGGELTRRYLRDVRIRHKQFKKGASQGTLPDSNKDWKVGYRDKEIKKKDPTTGKKTSTGTTKRVKVGLLSKHAPKGFRRHVATRSLARILTPIAIGTGIGYGIEKRKGRRENNS